MEPNILNTADQVINVSAGDIMAVVVLLASLAGSIIISLGLLVRRNREFVRSFPTESE